MGARAGAGANGGRQRQRECPWCGSAAMETVPRGYAGRTDENDQYSRCHGCGKITWEMVSKTAQELRLGRYEPGKSFTERGDRYLIKRILKVGFNEYLLYLTPSPVREGAQQTSSA
ncbi:MAG: hypothetical protein M3Q65_05205 [Chloroflexota bacterium]|nr:hypothetical protein [Chloroflexota bacterium]